MSGNSTLLSFMKGILYYDPSQDATVAFARSDTPLPMPKAVHVTSDVVVCMRSLRPGEDAENPVLSEDGGPVVVDRGILVLYQLKTSAKDAHPYFSIYPRYTKTPIPRPHW